VYANIVSIAVTLCPELSRPDRPYAVARTDIQNPRVDLNRSAKHPLEKLVSDLITQKELSVKQSLLHLLIKLRVLLSCRILFQI